VVHLRGFFPELFFKKLKAIGQNFKNLNLIQNNIVEILIMALGPFFFKKLKFQQDLLNMNHRCDNLWYVSMAFLLVFHMYFCLEIEMHDLPNLGEVMNLHLEVNGLIFPPRSHGLET
jgi:hypothetical protein